MTLDAQLPKGAESDIRSAISGSPLLSNLLAQAATDGHIGRVAVSYGQHNAGHFEAGKNGRPGILFVSASNFTDWPSGARIDLLTEVMGHETMHGVLTSNRQAALKEFSDSYKAAMQDAYDTRESALDLTDHVRKYLDYGRRDEALAEVAGLRALNSRLKQQNPDASDAQIESLLAERSTSRCAVVKDGNTVLADGISYQDLAKGPYQDGQALTGAVEKCYYDGKGTLGKHGDSDYRNYYGVDPIAQIARDSGFLAEARRPPEVRIRLAELGLEPRQLERNGLDLGKAQSIQIVDLGRNGFGDVQLRHTAQATDPSNRSPNRAAPDSESTQAVQLGQADRALLDQIRGKVSELDKTNGRTFDETSERISASLLAIAKDAGLTRVDHVLLSNKTATLPAAHNIFVVQGDPANPASVRAHLPTLEAAQRPVQESLDQVAVIGQRQAQEQATERQLDQERQQRGSGPSL
nr:XVIPCD domain-containing protein [Stenotrophomonas rhizophila]